MNTEENNLDLLDLDDDTPVETLPETTPFAAPRPRKPWMLMGLALIVIILAVYIIIRTIGNDSSKSVEINLDEPVVVGTDSVDVPNDTLNVPAKPVPVEVAPQPKPAAPQPVVENNGVPVRVVTERRDVTFNPAAEQPKPVAQPAPAPVAKPAPAPVAQPKPVAQPAPAPAAKPAAKPAPKPAAKQPVVKSTSTVARGGWYVQFGSYSSRALAESAERQMRAGHKSLFEGKQFVILAAQLPNGKTTYRLRVAFTSSNDANGFCQNAKSDGLDCYVAK